MKSKFGGIAVASKNQIQSKFGGIAVDNDKFNPEGDGYDYATAVAAGIQPDETGHWPSKDPITGQMLKGKAHETWGLAEQGEMEAGYKIAKGANGKYYSQPFGKSPDPYSGVSLDLAKNLIPIPEKEDLVGEGDALATQVAQSLNPKIQDIEYTNAEINKINAAMQKEDPKTEKEIIGYNNRGRLFNAALEQQRANLATFEPELNEFNAKEQQYTEKVENYNKAQEFAGESATNILAYAPYAATEVLKGVMKPLLSPLKTLGMDTEGVLDTAVEYWKEKAPDFKVPNIGIGTDKDGKNFGLHRVDDVSGKELVGSVAEGAGYIVPIGGAMTAGGLVADKVAVAARPFYKTILKGMVGGALLGEGKKDETLENMALFGVFEGAGYAIGKIPGAIKAVKKSNLYRKATIKERGLVVQSLEETLKANPEMSEAELVRRSNRYFAEAAEKRKTGEQTKTENQPKVKSEPMPEPEPEIPVSKFGGEFVENPKPTKMFESKKGNKYTKVDGKWLDEAGAEVTNKYKIRAAENGAKDFVEPKKEIKEESLAGEAKQAKATPDTNIPLFRGFAAGKEFRGKGSPIFFSSKRKAAEGYARMSKHLGEPTVGEYSVDIKNPKIYDGPLEKGKSTFATGSDQVKELKAQGYDGAVYIDNGIVKDVIAFDETQVRRVKPEVKPEVTPEQVAEQMESTVELEPMKGMKQVEKAKETAEKTVKPIDPNEGYVDIPDFIDDPYPTSVKVVEPEKSIIDEPTELTTQKAKTFDTNKADKEAAADSIGATKSYIEIRQNGEYFGRITISPDGDYVIKPADGKGVGGHYAVKTEKDLNDLFSGTHEKLNITDLMPEIKPGQVQLNDVIVESKIDTKAGEAKLAEDRKAGKEIKSIDVIKEFGSAAFKDRRNADKAIDSYVDGLYGRRKDDLVVVGKPGYKKGKVVPWKIKSYAEKAAVKKGENWEVFEKDNGYLIRGKEEAGLKSLPKESVEQKEKKVQKLTEEKNDYIPVAYDKALADKYAKIVKSAYASGDLEAPQYMVALDLIAKKDLDSVKKIINLLPGDSPNLADAVIKGKGKADLKRLIGMLGSQMYKNNLAEVTIKEIVQNSFDAVKATLNNGKVKAGKIDILTDTGNRIIAIRDNGQGMSKDVILNAFLTVAGTSKEGMKAGEASGGFGMAKAAFLYGNEWISVNTVKDGKQYSFKATGDDLLSKEIDIIQKDVSKDKHGTVIIIKVPEYVVAEGQEKYVWFPENVGEISFFKKPMLHDNVELTTKDLRIDEDMLSQLTDQNNSLWDRAKDNFIKVGKHFDLSKYAKNTTAKFDWGKADIYIGKNRKGTWETRHEILSSGIFQFTTNFEIRQFESIPYDIIINVKPEVDASSASYPFNVRREGWKETIKPDINSLSAYLKNIAQGTEAQETVDQFKNIKSLPRVEIENVGTNDINIEEFFTKQPERSKIKLPDYSPTEITVTGGVVKGKDIKGEEKIYADTNKKGDEKLKSSFDAGKSIQTAKDFLIETGVDDSKPVFHNNTNVDYFSVAKQHGLSAETFFAELGSTMLKIKDIVVDKNLWGYEKLTDKDSSFFFGISIDKGYHGVNTVVPFNAIFINPLAVKETTLPGLAFGYYDTLIHELTHIPQRNHDQSFISEMAKLHSKLASDGTDLELRVILARVLKKHKKLINILRREYEKSTTQNIAKALDKVEGDGGIASRRTKDGSKTSAGERNAERTKLSEREAGQRIDSGVQDGVKGSKGITLNSGVDPLAAAATITKSAKEMWERGINRSVQTKGNLKLTYDHLQKLFLDPEKISRRDPYAKKAFFALVNAEEAKNAFVYRNYQAYMKATKGIKKDSIAAANIGRALDGQVPATNLTKQEKRAYDFFKQNYDAMITEFARRAAGSEEAYQRILRTVASDTPKRTKVKDLTGTDKENYWKIKDEIKAVYNGRKLRELTKAEIRQIDALKLQTKDILNNDWKKKLPPNEAEVYDILSRKIIDYFPHLFNKEEILATFKTELADAKSKLSKTTNKASETKYKNLINKYEAAIKKMEGGGLVTFDQLPGSVFFKFFSPRRGKVGYSFDAMKAYEAYMYGLARKMFDEPAVKLIKQNLFDSIDPGMKPYTEALVRRYMGWDKNPLDWFAGAITSFEWMRTLGLNPRSALVNLSQRLNTVVYAGEQWSAKAQADMTREIVTRKKSEASLAFDESGIAREVPHVLTEGDMSESMEKLRSVVGFMFNSIELSNRKHAFIAGYSKAKASGATKEKAMQAGQRTVHKTQFRYGKLGMPKIFWNPAARVGLQFSSYAIKQAQFIYDLGEFDNLFTKSGELKQNGTKRFSGLIKLIKYLMYASGLSYGLKEFFDADMDNALGIGITWGEAFKGVAALATGDTQAAYRHTRLAVNPGSGLLPSGPGPAASGVVNVLKATEKGKGIEQLVEELKPVMYSRIKQFLDAEKTRAGEYIVRGKSKNALYRLSKRQLIQRTIGPKTAEEGRTQKKYKEDQVFELERQAGIKGVIDALIDGDNKRVEKLVQKNKEAMILVFSQKGLFEKMVERELMRRNFTGSELEKLKKKPGVKEMYREIKKKKL